MSAAKELGVASNLPKLINRRIGLVLWLMVGDKMPKINSSGDIKPTKPMTRPSSTSAPASQVLNNVWAVKAFLRWLPSLPAHMSSNTAASETLDKDNEGDSWEAPGASDNDAIAGAIQRIQLLCKISNFNLTRCCQQNLVEECIDTLSTWTHATTRQRKELVVLLVVLGKHAMNRRAARKMLRHLSSYTEDTVPYRILQLQWAAVQMCKGNKEPPFYELDGIGSYIDVPGLQGIGTGYAVHMWLRIESLSPLVLPVTNQLPLRQQLSFPYNRKVEYTRHNSAVDGTRESKDTLKQTMPGYEPRLFVLSKQGITKVETFVSAGRIAIHVAAGQDWFTHVFTNAKIPVQQWFCLTMTHSKGRTLLANSEFKVFIDGILVDKAAIKLPTGITSSCDMTVCGKRGRTEKKIEAIKYLRSLQCQVASLYIMQPVTDAAVQGMYKLGVHYTGLFEAHTFGDMQVDAHDAFVDDDSSQASGGSGSLSSRLTKKVVVWCHPRATDATKNLARNVAAYSRGPGADNQEHQASINGRVCVHYTAVEMFCAEGGACMTVVAMRSGRKFQMLTTGNQQLQDLSMRLNIDDVSDEKSLPCAFSVAHTSLVLELLWQLLREHPGTSPVPDDERKQALAMAAHMFESEATAKLSTICVRSIMGLLNFASVSPTTLDTILGGLVFNFELWNKTSDGAKVTHAEAILEIVNKNDKFCREHYGIWHSLNSLQLYQEDTSVNNKLRGYILDLVDVYASRSLNSDEMGAILNFIRNSSDLSLAAEVAEWVQRSIYAWLKQNQNVQQNEGAAELPLSRTGKNFESVMCTKKPPYELYACLSRHSPRIRAAVLWIIATLCTGSTLLNEEGRASLRLSNVGFAGVGALLTGGPVSNECTEAFIAIGTQICPASSESDAPAPASKLVPKRPRSRSAIIERPLSAMLDVVGTPSPTDSMPRHLSVSGSDLLPQRSSTSERRSRSKSFAGRRQFIFQLDNDHSVRDLTAKRRIVSPSALDAALLVASDDSAMIDNSSEQGYGQGSRHIHRHVLWGCFLVSKNHRRHQISLSTRKP